MFVWPDCSPDRTNTGNGGDTGNLVKNLARKQWRVVEAAQDNAKFCVIMMSPDDVNGMVYFFARTQPLAVEVANLLNERDGYPKVKP